MTAVMFERRAGMYVVTFTYDPMIVEMLKLVVPSYARTWSKPRREWLIETVYGKPLADALGRLGATVIGLDDPPHRQHATDPAGWAKAVFQRVGPNRAPLAYRLLWVVPPRPRRRPPTPNRTQPRLRRTTHPEEIRMTDQPRAACCVCFAAYCESGRRRCDSCDIAHQPVTKPPAPKPLDLSKPLPENLAGYTLEDFL